LQNHLSPSQAIDAAKKLNINLSGHHSNIINADFIEKSDIVFVFDCSIFMYIASRYPSSLQKIYFLGALGPDDPIIEDPAGKPVEECVKCYRQIIDSINAFKF
jgi:protein-tyrosine-phosphatase